MDYDYETAINRLKERIATLRLEKGVSERELSMDIGKGHTYVSDLNYRSSNPTLKTLLNIANYFGLTLPELFDDDYKKPTTAKSIDKELRRVSGDSYDALPELLSKLSEEDFANLIRLSHLLSDWARG